MAPILRHCCVRLAFRKVAGDKELPGRTPGVNGAGASTSLGGRDVAHYRQAEGRNERRGYSAGPRRHRSVFWPVSEPVVEVAGDGPLVITHSQRLRCA